MPYLEVKKSTRGNKKYMAIFYDHNKKKVKTVHFGASGYEDFTQHKNEFRKERYLNRHRNEDWGNPMSAGSLSRWILWEYPDFNRAVREFMRRFGFRPL